MAEIIQIEMGIGEGIELAFQTECMRKRGQ
jgi:hypothetical protein